MRALVTFTTATGRYAIDVAHVGRVAEIEEPLQPLPAPKPGVAGVARIAGRTLPVLDVLGAGGEQLLVLQAVETPCALRVGEVTGVVRLRPDEQLEPAPAGQNQPLVSGVVPGCNGSLVVDAVSIARYFGS